ncbi:MAG TPA: hypothetical protein VMT26_04085 [Candidatus Bathyarchaeia archaeon]|jgi:uncharacterized membrane protein YdbT with pleckstrin-like domain|nr:hypothetical protein [Candidatus Bathyarchaeia archaeon]
MAAAQEIQQSTSSSEQVLEENVSQEEYVNAEETEEETQKQEKNKKSGNNGENKVEFVNGLFVGVGVGCISTFVIIWVSLFFTPQLPQAISYQSMLSVFIYPLFYLLAVGLVALTAGVVREYFSARRSN